MQTNVEQLYLEYGYVCIVLYSYPTIFSNYLGGLFLDSFHFAMESGRFCLWLFYDVPFVRQFAKESMLFALRRELG